MVTPVSEPVFLTLRGIGYNVMLQKPDNYGRFKVDLILEGEELGKAQAYQQLYGIKIRDQLQYALNGERKSLNTKYVTFKAKHVPPGEGVKFPRTFVPAFLASDPTKEVTDFISHGADLTVHFRIFPYAGGTNAAGFSYPAGNGNQLDKVEIHSYVPFILSPKTKR